jgi:hypothetical protein
MISWRKSVIRQHNLNIEAVQLFNRYPREIKKILFDLFESILSVIDVKNVVSILLIGSTARDELSYLHGENGFDIYSDFEFVVIVKRMMTRDSKKKLDSILDQLIKKWSIKSPLFHIDYGISTYTKFVHTPPILWAFEAKYLGVVVFGKDVRADLIDVNIENLDYGNLNELIIVRLWNMLIQVKNTFLYSTQSDYEEFILKFFYARNILDVLTIYLPNKGFLIGGYKKRTDHFSKKCTDEKWHEFVKKINKVTDFKLLLKDSLPLLDLQKQFLNGFITLVEDIAGLKGSIIKSNEQVRRLQKNQIFKEKIVRRLRRKYIEFKLYRGYYKYSLNSMKLFTRDNLRINLLMLLLFMHLSIQIDIDRSEKIKYFEKAVSYAAKLKLAFVYKTTSRFEDNWINLRNSLLDFMMIWFYARMNITRDEISKNF